MAYILKKLHGLVRRSAQMTAQLVSKPAGRINSRGWTGSRCYSTSGFIHGKFIPAYGQHFSWHDHSVSSLIRWQIGGTCGPNAITTTVEFARQIHFGERLVLSTQYLVDPGSKYGSSILEAEEVSKTRLFMNHFKAMPWAMMDGGLVLRDDYRMGKLDGRRAGIVQAYHLTDMEPNDLASFILRQPIIIVISVSDSFDGYTRGIFKNDMGFKPFERDFKRKLIRSAHAVVAIGWYYSNGELSFLIQNSYGKNWGFRGCGYIHQSCVCLELGPIIASDREGRL